MCKISALIVSNNIKNSPFASIANKSTLISLMMVKNGLCAISARDGSILNAQISIWIIMPMLFLIVSNARKLRLYKMGMELDPVEEIQTLQELLQGKYLKEEKHKNVCSIILDSIGSLALLN